MTGEVVFNGDVRVVDEEGISGVRVPVETEVKRSVKM